MEFAHVDLTVLVEGSEVGNDYVTSHCTYPMMSRHSYYVGARPQ